VHRSSAPLAELEEEDEIELNPDSVMPPTAESAIIVPRSSSIKLIAITVLAVAIAIAAWLGIRS
jgi:hypothetical protein